MSVNAALLAELDQEFAATRRILEAVPTDRFGFKPHEKSYSAAQLAMHVAMMPTWGEMTMSTEELDLATVDEAAVPDSIETVLAAFDQGVTAFRSKLEAATADDMGFVWKMRSGDHEILAMPRGAVLRGFIINHMIHHRGQLSVVLRLMDIPVPQTYGPTADFAQ